MNKIYSILITIFIFISCSKDEVLLDSDLYLNSLMEEYYNFKITKDSTYQFLSNKVLFDESSEKDSVTGIISLKNDTIYLKANKVNENFQFDKAIIKNGFIEFMHDSRCCIQKYRLLHSQFKEKVTIDFSNYPKYAVFPYLSNKENEIPYDLDQNDIQAIDFLLQKEMQSNTELRDYKDYLIQLSSYQDIRKEIMVIAHLLCENFTRDERFKYQEISIKDGGDCNVYIKINLTKKEIKEVIIAGEV